MMAESPAQKTAYFEKDGKPYAVPLSQTDVIVRFRDDPAYRQISQYEADVLAEAVDLQESPVLGRLEALGRGAVSGATLGLGQLAMDPVELAAAKEAFPGAYYTGDIGTSVASAILSGGAGAAARGGVAALARKTPAGVVARAAEKAAAAPIAKVTGEGLVGKATRSVAPLAIAGAVEGGVASATYGMADKFLENPNATAEELLSYGAAQIPDGLMLGAGVGGALSGAKTLAAGTIKGANALAKKVYADSVDRFGDGFSESVAKFIAADDPAAQRAMADELSKVLRFQEDFQGIAARIDNMQKYAAEMKAAGKDTDEIKAYFKEEIAALRKEYNALNKSENTKALNNLSAQLNESKTKAAKAFADGQDEILGGMADDLGDITSGARGILGEFGDTKVRLGDYQVASTIDEVIDQRFADDLAAQRVFSTVDQGKALNQAINGEEGFYQKSLNSYTRMLSDPRITEQAKKIIRDAIGEIESARQLYADVLARAQKEGAISNADLLEIYRKQRKVLRQLEYAPNQIAKATGDFTPGGLKRDAIAAKDFFKQLHIDEDIFGGAAALEKARLGIVDTSRTLLGNVGKLDDLLPEEIVKKLRSEIFTRRKGIGDTVTFYRMPDVIEPLLSSIDDQILEFTELAGRPELRKKLNKIREAIERTRSRTNRLGEYQKSIEQIQRLKGKSMSELFDEASDAKSLEGLGVSQEAADNIASSYSKLMESLESFVNKDVVLPEEVTQRLADIQEEVLQLDVMRGRVKEFAEASVPKPADENIEQLLAYRAQGGTSASDAAAALAAASGIPGISQAGAAILVANRLKSSPLQFMQTVSALSNVARKTSQVIDKGADYALNVAISGKAPEKYVRGTSVLGRVLGATGAIIAEPGDVPDDKKYEKTVKRVRELRDDPQRLAGVVESIKSPGVEALSEPLQAATVRAFNYLAEVTPDLAEPGLLDRYDPEPTPEQKQNFAVAVEVINNPVKLFYYHLANNTLTSQVTDPFKAIYPDLYSRVTESVFDKFTRARKELPYASRVQMGLTYGAGMESTVSPEFVAMNQQMYTSPGQEQGGGVNMTQGGVGKLSKSAAAYQTPGQRMMGA